jgi:transcriptional repressor NrdR
VPAVLEGSKGLRCPYCKANNDRVIDSRTSGEADVIRRRRECLECDGRFTTYEKIGETPLRVVKKDGTRVPFDRDKILRGMLVACEKRSIATDVLEGIVTDIETQLHEMFDKEVASKYIGHLVMEALGKLDQVAYVRFASVYREFKDVNQFLDELKPLLGGAGGDPAEAAAAARRSGEAASGRARSGGSGSDGHGGGGDGPAQS